MPRSRAQEPCVDNGGNRTARIRAKLGRCVGATAFECLFEIRKEIRRVNRRPRQIVQTLNRYGNADDEQNEQGPHGPSAVLKKLYHFFPSRFNVSPGLTNRPEQCLVLLLLRLFAPEELPLELFLLGLGRPELPDALLGHLLPSRIGFGFLKGGDGSFLVAFPHQIVALE